MNIQRFNKALAAAISGAITGFLTPYLCLRADESATLSSFIVAAVVYLIPNKNGGPQ